MEDSNDSTSDSLLRTGDAFLDRSSGIRFGHNHYYDESNNIHHDASRIASSKYYGDDTIPFNVAEFLDYFASRDNDIPVS